MDGKKISQFFHDMMESIIALTEDKPEGHFAIKMTSMISIDVMTRLSQAQLTFMRDILKFG